MNYAIYFNKKYKRSGHLWQGRFKSWYVTDEAYLYTLMLYIEQNPLKANMVKDIKEYPYSSYHYFLNYKEDKESIEAFLTNPVDTAQLQELKRASSLVEAPNIDTKPKEEDLLVMFENITEIKKRNETIANAYAKGYSQHMIARVLGLAQSTVNGIVKRMNR